MAVYLVTGRLGAGKSLVAVGKAREYAEAGRRVAANFHIDLAPVARRRGSKVSQASVTVIPARPSALELASLGVGGEREERAGLLILDECGTFLNAREWSAKDRKEVIHWLLHSRKLGWDVMLLVQHQSMLDKQIREAVCEFLVTCRRLDRMKIPIVSWLLPWKVTWPRVHVAQVRYGLGVNDPTAETWIYRGVELFACYSTKWVSVADTGEGCYSVLPALLTKWRYEVLKRGFLLRLLRGPGAGARKVVKVKNPLLVLLSRLPAGERMKHWHRLHALGAV